MPENKAPDTSQAPKTTGASPSINPKIVEEIQLMGESLFCKGVVDMGPIKQGDQPLTPHIPNPDAMERSRKQQDSCRKS